MSKLNDYIKEAYTKGYRVSADGTVYSYTGNQLIVNYQGRPPHRYARFSLKGNKVVIVHKLQAYQKFGEKIFQNGMVVRHLNGITTDNSVNNIGMGSQSDNMMDIPEETRLATALIAAKVQRKLTWEEAELLRKDYVAGLTNKELCEKYELAKSTVSYIVNNKTYTRN